MITHTPGPWVADDFCMHLSEKVRVGTDDGTPQYYHKTSTICQATVSYRGYNEDDALLSPGERRIGVLEAQANARLIAAAPDLLDALKYARRMLNSQDHDVAFVDDAIAKAVGGRA